MRPFVMQSPACGLGCVETAPFQRNALHPTDCERSQPNARSQIDASSHSSSVIAPTRDSRDHRPASTLHPYALAPIHGMTPLTSSFPNRRSHCTVAPPATFPPWAVTKSNLVQGTSKRRVEFGGDADEDSTDDRRRHESASPTTSRSVRSKRSRFDFAAFSRTGIRKPPRGTPSASVVLSDSGRSSMQERPYELSLDDILDTTDALEIQSMLAMAGSDAYPDATGHEAPPTVCKSPSFVELNLSDACDMTDIFATLCAEDEAGSRTGVFDDDAVINLPTPERGTVGDRGASPIDAHSSLLEPPPPPPPPPLPPLRNTTAKERKRVYVPTGRPRGRPRLDGTCLRNTPAQTTALLEQHRPRRNPSALRRSSSDHSWLLCTERLPPGLPCTWPSLPRKRRAVARNVPRGTVLLDYGDWKGMHPTQIMTNAFNMKTIQTLCSYRMLAHHLA